MMCSPDHFITVEKMYSESTAHVILLLMFSFSHLNDTEALLPHHFTLLLSQKETNRMRIC